MNETLEILLNRRSIKVYKDEQIKDEELQTILEAGKFAPSAMNEQPWHFTVVQNKEMLQKITDVTKEVYEQSGIPAYQERARAENFSPFYNAPTYIIVSTDKNALAPQADSAAALGNLLIAAEALGIGSSWIHVIDFAHTTEKGKVLSKELGIPKGYIPQCSGSFGYNGAEKPLAPTRRDGTVNIV